MSIDILSEVEKGQSPVSIPSGESNRPTNSWSSEGATLTASETPNGSNPLNLCSTTVKDLQQRLRVALSGKCPVLQVVKKPRENIIKNIDNCPRGYPLLAAFLDSDENFMVYRRFGFLHARLLLQKQDQLRVMEEALAELDERDFKNDENRYLLQCREDDEDQPPASGGESRTQLLQRIEDCLLKYDEILLKAQQLIVANRPAFRDYTSVKTFFHNKKPLVEGDADFIYNIEDLITLRPGRETAWLDRFIERVLKMFPRGVQHLFRSRDTARKSEDPNIRYFTKSRMECLVNVVLLAVILALLVVPVYTLYHVDAMNSTTGSAVCIGILLVATLLFSAVLSLFTQARRHEVLAGSAAYCAILVVFIGNIGVQSVQSAH